MIKRTFQEIAELSGGRCSDDVKQELAIQGVSTDTRSIQPGNLFIPLVGARYDGHEYVSEAASKGAAASLWQKDRPNPPAGVPLIFVDDTLAALQRLSKNYRNQLNVRIVGITGSNGKTTTKDMVASILETTYNVHKTKGNLNNHIGLPLTLLQLDEQTQMAVVEMGMSGPGEIELLSGLARPEAAIITNIGEAHLLQLGSREQIARAKLEIVSGLKEDGLLVYHGDEPLLEQMMAGMSLPGTMLRFRFGASPTNDFYPEGVMLDNESQGTYFSLNETNSPAFFIPLLGYHNVINALAAIAVSKYMGVSEKDIQAGLKCMKATGMRIEIVRGSTGLTILNDAYNASPTSTKAAIELLKQLKGYGQKIVVLGDMLELGEQEQRFHREIGSLLKPRVADYIFTYGALASLIADEAEGAFSPGRVRTFASKTDLVKQLASIASSKDIVLVKGSRGMRLEDVVNELKGMHI